MKVLENINYEFNDLIELVVEFEPLIESNYYFENFILSFSVENSHDDKTFIRICLKNDISNICDSSNGVITLIHKIYEVNKNIEENINNCIIKFFSIQNDLKGLNFNIDFTISDCRK